MRVLFINPPIREWSKPNVLPLGIAYLTASLRRATEADVQVMDWNAYRWDDETALRMIEEAKPDLICFGGIVTIYKWAKWFCREVKARLPHVPIAVGGALGTSSWKVLLTYAEADICGIGEGERTIVELVQCLEAGGDLNLVQGIAWKDADGRIQQTAPRPTIEDLDTLPEPAWDDFPMDVYLNNPLGAPNRSKWRAGETSLDVRTGEDRLIRSMNINGVRGCPFRCTYCYHDFMGGGYRKRSPKHIVDEIELLYRRYNVEYIHFIDDEFALDRKFVEAFCDEMVARGLHDTVTWGGTWHVNATRESTLRRMVDAGCVMVCYGIESGSQTILDELVKGVKREKALQSVLLTKQYVYTDITFMVGAPSESPETVQETIDFINEAGLKPDAIFFCTPYPGTALWRYVLDRGYITPGEAEDAYLSALGEQGEQIVCNMTRWSDEELHAMQQQIIEATGAGNVFRHPEAHRA